jgi:ABC-type transport system involved in cytochrome bd biosynthesis fused ATPase/permease subunit
VLLIVHRRELAAQADRILQLQDGRIVEPTAAAA